MPDRPIVVAGRGVGAAAVLAVLLAAQRAAGVTVDNLDAAVADTNPANVGGIYSNFTYFNNVGIYAYGNAIYLGLDGNYVLTAYHVYSDAPTGPITFGNTVVNLDPTFTPVQLVNPPGVPGAGQPTDLVLLRLQGTDTNGNPYTLPSVPISSSPQAVSNQVLMIGAGRPQSSSTPTTWYVDQSTNPWTWNTTQQSPPLPVYQGYVDGGGARVERWGANLISTNNIAVNDGVGIVTSFITSFDSTTNGGIQYEASAVLNDSGGAVFSQNGTNWLLTGLMYATSSPLSGQPGGDSTAILDNTLTYSADLSYYRSAIYAALPSLVWDGSSSGTWNYAAVNWNAGGTYTNTKPAILGDLGTNTAINLSVVVTPLSLTVSNNLVAYSISGSGSINGSTSLVKNGTNTLTLSTSNGYTGGTAINAGLVKFTQAAALPPTGTVTVGNGGTLAANVGGTGEFSNATSGVDSLGNVINAPTWAVGSTLGVDTTNAGGSLTYTGVIAGNMGLNKLGNGTLFLTAAPTYAGATTVTAGTLQTPQIANNNSLTIASGAKVVLTTNGGLNPNASVVSSLAIAGTLDLGDNGLIVTGATSATESAVAALIASGFNGGDWQGTGITSSTVAAHSTSMTIAYDFASNIHLTFSGGFATWGGQSISSTNASTDLLVMPTLIGDANMDGYVNFVDVTEMIPNLGSTPGQTWGGGDFSGDGYVNFVDVTELIPNLGGSVSVLSPDVAPGFGGAGVNPGAPADVTVAPEPASLVLLGLGGMMILGGRRRADRTARR